MKLPVSSLQRKVAVVSVSVNEKLALDELDGLLGCDVIVGAGGATVSIVHVYEVAALTLPAASFASTEKVCEPSARVVYACGLVHATKLPVSSLHRKLTPVSVSLKLKLAFELFDGFDGFDVIVGAGGATVSIVHV